MCGGVRCCSLGLNGTRCGPDGTGWVGPGRSDWGWIGLGGVQLGGTVGLCGLELDWVGPCGVAMQAGWGQVGLGRAGMQAQKRTPPKPGLDRTLMLDPP